MCTINDNLMIIEGVTFFRGVSFYIKNKLKSEIFNNI